MSSPPPPSPRVIVVDAKDQPVGEMEKLAAHQPPGTRHRAFSVVILDGDQMLLQQRAFTKHTFAGLWANACCSHPEPGDDLASAARRRLQFEIGFDSIDLTPVGHFEYRATDDQTGLVEHEIDHVLVGTAAPVAEPNPAEVDDLQWVDVAFLERDLVDRPERYCPWLPLIVATLAAAHWPDDVAVAGTA